MADLVAFNSTDASALLARLMLSGSDGIAQPDHPRTGILLGKTKSGGLAGNASGNVFYMEPNSTSWVVTATEYLAYNATPDAIPGDKTILLLPINGRYTAWEIC